MPDFSKALALAADLLVDLQCVDLDNPSDRPLVIKLARCFERDQVLRNGRIRQEPDLVSLQRVGNAVRACLAQSARALPDQRDVVRHCIPFRCPTPELLVARGVRCPRRKPSAAAARFAARVKSAPTKEIDVPLPDTTPSLGLDDRVVIEPGDPNDKIGQFDRALDRSGFLEHLERAFSDSEKPKDEFAIAIKPNIMMIFRLSDEGTYTDPVLVLRLVERIGEQGFSNISVVEAQNLYGNWYGNREVVKVAAHGGYLGKEVFQKFEPTADHFGHVLVRQKPHPVKIVDMTLDRPVAVRFEQPRLGQQNLGRAWVEADYRINFPKFKTHFFNFYTALVKNTYGCLPAQDKIKHYHYKKITHQLTAAQLQRLPVHFSFVDAITGADGIFGAKMQAESKKPGLILAGAPMLVMESLCGQLMGYDPYVSDFFTSAVKSTGDLKAVKLHGPVELIKGWSNVPRFVDDLSSFGEYFYHLGVHFGHIFTGDNDPCFPHTGHLIRLRRILAIFPYPVLWLTNLDQIRVRFFRFRMRRFCKANADRFPLCATNQTFFNWIYRFGLKDMTALSAFLNAHGSFVADQNVALQRFGHRIQVGNAVLSLRSMKHFAPQSALELLQGIRAGDFDLEGVIRELDGWRKIEVPSFLRKHLLIDSPYLCGNGSDAS